jgi:hypothetical protein
MGLWNSAGTGTGSLSVCQSSSPLVEDDADLNIEGTGMDSNHLLILTSFIFSLEGYN